MPRDPHSGNQHPAGWCKDLNPGTAKDLNEHAHAPEVAGRTAYEVRRYTIDSRTSPTTS